MIKLFLGIILVVLSSLIGVKLADKEKYRKEVFESLLTLNLTLINDVGLFSNALDVRLKNLPKSLKSAFFGIEKIFDGERFFCVDNQLTDEQKDFISSYVNFLGSGDSNSQLDMLNSYTNTIKTILESQKTIYQKYAKLCARLGVSFGLILLVVII